jgi:hypothetical protein
MTQALTTLHKEDEEETLNVEKPKSTSWFGDIWDKFKTGVVDAKNAVVGGYNKVVKFCFNKVVNTCITSVLKLKLTSDLVNKVLKGIPL